MAVRLASLMLVVAALALVLPSALAVYQNPCCPGSPYNGEDVKMNMLKGLKAKGQYSIFLKALFQTSEYGCPFGAM